MPKYKVTLTPADNFSGHSKVRFGVGERIKVKADEQPAAKQPADAEWFVKSGPVAVKNDKAPGVAVVTCGNKPGAAVLELRDPKSKTVYATQRLEVVAPTGVTFLHKPVTIKYGLKFKGYSQLEPFDVSFKWVETREGAAPYEGNGCFKKTEVSVDELADEYAVIHPVQGAWTPNLGGAKKNREDAVDTVMTAQAKWDDGGTFVWRIPWFYRVHGMNGEFRFTTAVHEAKISKSGQMTLSKFNVTLKRQLLPSK
jgi:hypothetical protein